MADAHERRRGLSLSLPLVPGRLPLPNPLAWVPRPRLSRRRRLMPANGAGVAIQDSRQGAAAAATAAAVAATPPAKVPLKPATDVFAGALARAASQSTIHPLDTLKVRLQAGVVAARNAPPPVGLSKIAQLLPPAPSVRPPRLDLASLGTTVGGLYKGVFGAASGAGIAIGAYFAVYGAACNVLARQAPAMPAGQVAFVAGGVAAAGSSFVKVPLAVCIRSVQAGVYPNAFNAARQIVATAGPRGLFTVSTGYTMALQTTTRGVPYECLQSASA